MLSLGIDSVCSHSTVVVAWTASLLRSFLHHSSPKNLQLIHWLVLSAGLNQSHALDDSHATLDSAKDRVFPVQPRRRREGDEELTAIGVRSAVRHAENPSARVLEVSVDLVFKFLAVDGASSSTSAGRVTGLDHEVRDDAVEDHIVVVSSFGKGREVLACLCVKRSVCDFSQLYGGCSYLGRMGIVELHGERAL